MKKIIIALLAFAAVIGMKASEPKPFCVEVQDFGELKVVDGINVVYKCSADSAGYATFTCDPKLSPLIMFSNNKNTLKIELQPDGLPSKGLPTITVYSRFLSKAENSGDSTIRVETPAPSAEIKMVVIGNGTIVAKGLHSTTVNGRVDAGKGHLVLSGTTQWVKLRTFGTGSIEAGDLKAEKGSLTMSGTGSVDCWVTGELTVTGLSTGSVYLKGNPTIKNRTLGSVKVVNVE